MVTDAKNPTKVRAGKAGALSRWGPPGTRVVRLDDLTPPQREVVAGLIEAQRIANAAARNDDEAA